MQVLTNLRSVWSLARIETDATVNGKRKRSSNNWKFYFKVCTKTPNIKYDVVYLYRGWNAKNSNKGADELDCKAHVLANHGQ